MFSFPQTAAKSFPVMGLLFFLLALVSPLAGQETRDPGPFSGFWSLTEPVGDNCIVIIKRGGRASCFFPGSGSNKIMQGKWERNEDRLVATWQNGHRDVFEVISETTLRRLAFPEGLPLTGTPAYENRATMVDRRMPGSLRNESAEDEGPGAMARRREEAAQDVTLVNSPLIGYWQVEQDRGLLRGDEPFFFLQLQRGGTARIALREWDLGNDMLGRWEMQGRNAVITWQEGWRDVLRVSGDAFELAQFGPRQEIEDRPRNRHPATRAPVATAQRLFTAGATDVMTATDIRGSWAPAENGQPGERIQLEAWGRAFRHPGTSPEGADEGRWRLLTDHVLIEWVDGSRDILRLGARSLVQESFPAGADPAAPPSRTVPVDKVVNVES